MIFIEISNLWLQGNYQMREFCNELCFLSEPTPPRARELNKQYCYRGLWLGELWDQMSILRNTIIRTYNYTTLSTLPSLMLCCYVKWNNYSNNFQQAPSVFFQILSRRIWCVWRDIFAMSPAWRWIPVAPVAGSGDQEGGVPPTS